MASKAGKKSRSSAVKKSPPAAREAPETAQLAAEAAHARSREFRLSALSRPSETVTVRRIIAVALVLILIALLFICFPCRRCAPGSDKDTGVTESNTSSISEEKEKSRPPEKPRRHGPRSGHRVIVPPEEAPPLPVKSDIFYLYVTPGNETTASLAARLLKNSRRKNEIRDELGRPLPAGRILPEGTKVLVPAW